MTDVDQLAEEIFRAVNDYIDSRLGPLEERLHALDGRDMPLDKRFSTLEARMATLQAQMHSKILGEEVLKLKAVGSE